MRNQRFAFRLTEQELASIRRKASQAGHTVTDFLITSALGQEIVILNDLAPFLSQLKGVGRNLNQLTLLANAGTIQCVDLQECLDTLGSVYEVVEKISQKVSHGSC